MDPAEEDGQHHAVIVQHASGNTVVHRLETEEGEELVRETIATDIHVYTYSLLQLYLCKDLTWPQGYVLSRRPIK